MSFLFDANLAHESSKTSKVICRSWISW